MDAPPVQYVKTSDGYDIAYAVRGEGMPLIFLPANFRHVQLAWRYPGLDDWLPALAKRFKLVQFDSRGTGMSTRGLPDDMEPLDFVRDLEAVINKLNLDRFVLFGCGRPLYVALDYVIRHPEKVEAFVAAGGPQPRTLAQWEPLPEQDWDMFLYSVVPRDRPPEDARLIVDMLKQSFDQHDFLTIARGWGADDAAKLLSNLQTPALFLHARDYLLMDASQAMKAAQLCGGQLVLIDGNTIFGDVDQGMSAIEAFLAEIGLPSGRSGSLALSQREVEVLRLLAAGKSNQQIAEALVISVNTVNRHVSNVYAKTGAANRAEAATYAARHGIV
jgi:DNA-binding CsgD family transcriptional regulator/pimeloyl-ACP methyl ester carboxylesterase